MSEGQRQRLTAAQALAAAIPFDVPVAVISTCVRATLREDVERPQLRAAEGAFVRALAEPVRGIPQSDRGGLNAAAGNIAEAVVEVLLAYVGWQPVFHDDSPSSGGHGVDLVMLTPDLEKLVAIEIKATLQSRRWPRLASRKPEQLSPTWLDRPGNTGMAQADVISGDVFSMIAFVQFPRRQWKAVMSRDLIEYRPGPRQRNPARPLTDTRSCRLTF